MEEKKEIIDFIKYLKKTTPEEIRMITLSCYKVILLSSFTFGLRNEITKDCFRIIKEYVEICNRENEIFDYIIGNLDNFYLDDTINYLEDLDLLNESTYRYYDGVIADIEYAIKIKNPNKGKRRYCNFNTLLDSDYYYDRLNTLKKGK